MVYIDITHLFRLDWILRRTKCKYKEKGILLKKIGNTTFFITLTNIILMAMAFFVLKHENRYFQAPEDSFTHVYIPLQLGFNFLVMGLFLFISLNLFLLTKKLSVEEKTMAYFYRDWGLGFIGFFLSIVLFGFIPILLKMAWTL